MIFEKKARTLPHLFSAPLSQFWPLMMTTARIVGDSFYLRWLQTAYPQMVGSLGVGKQTLKFTFTRMKQKLNVQIKFYRNTIQFSKLFENVYLSEEIHPTDLYTGL